ncbi:MAG TPA: glycogen synthase [Herpetosiphon sp.]|uniref:Glycogen synthase n=1 Tax=Herpetosiphon aurantiacus (strain ATCC 23779 / DSM 785 / 114-95) TaxID=316274 RepID=A9B7V4_HERA2|nr:glycogen/starch synthase [Herpetosiphon sp.]ABX04482.1 glycogen/starch synthase, ADP-glucose type [Herpetosiphon aurantiacus DSM 785]HBW52265.1 glycogen synthase [Herpetosiphon sp.]
MNEQPLRILYFASEVEPFARTGGLAEVAASLPRALQALGHEVIVAMPRYGHIEPSRWQLEPSQITLTIPLADTAEPATWYTTALPDSDVKVWMVENQRLFGQPEVYLGDGDAERFVFWAKATLEIARDQGWQPDVVHLNDWHAAIVANWLRTSYRDDQFFANTASLYTIHTLAYRGVFGQRVLEMAGIAEYGYIAHSDMPSLHRVVDLMSRGIYYADMINTVSPTHAREILTPAFGEGLDPLLRDRRDRLFGVLNGIDNRRYNPATDSYLAQPFSYDDLTGKQACKIALQQQLGWEADPSKPLFCFIGRLNDQKGLGLLAETIENVLSHHQFQCVVMGTGEARYHEWLSDLQQRHPQQVAVALTFNEALAHQCYAGSDVLLMPSLVEPGGTNQLIAQRYGCLPLVCAVGGLADTVENINTYAGTGNGFGFTQPESQSLYGTMMRALELYRHPELWQAAVKRAMHCDWSWARSAQRYDELYRRALVSRAARRPRASYGDANERS